MILGQSLVNMENYTFPMQKSDFPLEFFAKNLWAYSVHTYLQSLRFSKKLNNTQNLTLLAVSCFPPLIVSRSVCDYLHRRQKDSNTTNLWDPSRDNLSPVIFLFIMSAVAEYRNTEWEWETKELYWKMTNPSTSQEEHR